MTDPFDPARLANLAALSRNLAAAGAPDAVSRPIVVDEQGYAYGLCPSDADGTQGDYIHPGVRISWAPMPIQGGLLLAIYGGPEADSGYEEEGVVAFMTRDGLRRLAADLQAIADASVPA